jgi:hypothetical protein
VTERWRKRLGDLDKQNPSDDLFERAKGGPQLPEEPISGPSVRTRIVTGVAAFLVFALAISVFVIPALRLRGTQSGVRGAGDVLLPLWPKRTLDGLQQLQNDANAGSAGWALDPEQVATRFGADVVGFAPVWAYELHNLSAFDECAGSSSSSGASCAYDPYIGPSSSSASPLRTYSLSQCGPSTAIQQTICDYDAIGPPNVSVVLYQPFGTGIWAVREVRSVYLQLSTSPGAAIQDQDDLGVIGSVPQGFQLDLGLHVGIGACDGNETASNHGPVAQAAGGNQPSFGSEAVGLTVGLDPSLTSGCSSEEPGYVFATLTDAPAGGDGLSTGKVVSGDKPRLLGFAVVPIVVQLPVAEASTGGSLSPSPTSVRWTTYTDSLGWTIAIPKDWVWQTIDGSDARLTYQGAAFGSAPLEQAPGGPTTIFPPDGEVMLTITHREGGPAVGPDADSTFPLSYDDLDQVDGGLLGTFRGDGLPFDLVIRFRDPTDQQVEILRHMVGSISFKPWSFGDERNGWVSLHDPSTDNAPDRTAHISWQQCDKTGCYVLAYGGDGPYGLGPIQTCGEGENMTADPPSSYSIVLECPNGSTQSWAVDGTPAPTNAPGDDVPLDHHPVIRAWDDTLLMNPSITIG